MKTKTKISKEELRDLILSGITTEELNSKYDYSHITDMSYMFDLCNGMFYGCSKLESVPLFNIMNVRFMDHMFYGCFNLKDIDPYNFPGYDFSELDNKFLKEKYPELYI